MSLKIRGHGPFTLVGTSFAKTRRRSTAYVDRPSRTSPPVYLRGGRPLNRGVGRRIDCHDADRHFPNINIPVVSVIWSYGGLSPTEMQDRITTVVERAMTTTVSDIEHVESQSLRGTSVIQALLSNRAPT